MMLTFDVFWSFRSPYSYLATKRLVRIAAVLHDGRHARAAGGEGGRAWRSTAARSR